MQKRVLSLLLVMVMVAGMLSTVVFAAEAESGNTAAAQITGVSIIVDGVTYTEGNVTITPTSTVVYVVTGTNFANLTDQNYLSFSENMGHFLKTSGWTVDAEANTATQDFSQHINYFTFCDNTEVQYSNDGSTTMIGTGIYLTYEDGVAEEDKAQITGVSVTVDGVTYTQGNITIRPNSTLVFAVTGTNFANMTNDRLFSWNGYHYVNVPESFTVDAETNTAVWDCTGSANYIYCNNTRVLYSNGGESWIGTDIYLTYDDGIAEEDRAQITGVTITVDGVDYTEGNVTITPTSTIVYTVTGTNFANLVNNVKVTFNGLHYIDMLSYFTVNTETNTAVWDCSAYINYFKDCNGHEVQYSNDSGVIWTRAGIYLTYDDSTGPESVDDLVFVAGPGLSFKEYIGMQVMISKTVADVYDRVWIEAVQEDPAGDITTTLEGVVYYGAYLKFEQPVLSWSMAENITMTLYAEKDGVTYIGQNVSVSVEELALSKIASYAASENTKAVTALVDMLNYGAAVQMAFGHYANALPNTNLGGYAGTAATPVFNAENTKTGEGTIAIAEDSISMQAKVEIHLLFQVDISAYKVSAKVGGADAPVVIDTEKYSTYGWTLVKVAVAADKMRDTFTISLVDANGTPVTQVYNVSIEAYGAAQIGGTYNDVVVAMMRYGDAVAAL